MKLIEDNDKLKIYIDYQERNTPVADELLAFIRQIPHKNKVSYFEVSIGYLSDFRNFLYYPFTEQEYLQGEREYNEFIRLLDQN